MIQGLRIAVAVFVVLVAQGTWVPRISWLGWQPDLLLGVVFFVSLKKGLHWGVWTGFIIGLLVDIEQPERLGLHSLAYVLSAFGIERWSKNFDRSSPIVVGILFFLIALGTETIRGFALSESLLQWLIGIFRWYLPGALYTLLWVGGTSWILSRVFGWKDWVLHAT